MTGPTRAAVNQDGSLHFILIDGDLTDPAYAPQGKVLVDFQRGSIVDQPPFRNLMATIQPQIAQAGFAATANAMGCRVSLIDAQTQAQTDAAALSVALAGVDPVAITAAQAKAAASAQAMIQAQSNLALAVAATVSAGAAVAG